jgi:hypothetical protein
MRITKIKPNHLHLQFTYSYLKFRTGLVGTGTNTSHSYFVVPLIERFLPETYRYLAVQYFKVPYLFAIAESEKSK